MPIGLIHGYGMIPYGGGLYGYGMTVEGDADAEVPPITLPLTAQDRSGATAFVMTSGDGSECVGIRRRAA